jgi:type I restriction enzyme S subunit
MLKKCKPLPAIEEDEIPYKLPKEWKWVRLEDLVSLLGDGLHGTPKYSDHGDYFFINGNNLSNGEILIKDDTKSVSVDEYNKYKKKLNDRTVLVSINGTLGNVAFYNNEKIILGKSACYFNLFNGINKFYLKLLINSSYFLEYAFKNATGTTIKNVSLKSMRLFLVPLPPLAEQKRIVSKIDELMTLCDKLESRRQKKQEIQSKLNGAALDRMLSAENQEEFEQNWQHICENFDLLYDNPENVEKLKQVILQLAVQGKLVPQNMEDEPASILIEKIKVEKKALIKEKKIKQIKVDYIEDENLPFNLPNEWIWTRLGNLCLQVSDGPHYSPNYVSEEEGVPFLSARNIKVDKFELDSAKYISLEDHEEFCKRVKPQKGDILYTKGGTTGIAKVNDLDFEFSVWVHVAVLKIAQNFVDPYYLALALNSPLCYEQSQKFTHGSSNRDLGLTRMVNILLPFPPLEEQKHIVEKVEQLMGLCDELEAKLRKEREDIEKLTKAVVKGLLEGADTEKTELEEPIPLQVAAIKLK